MRATFKQSDFTRAMKATIAAGITAFDIIPGPSGEPIIRVRPGPSSDTPQDVLDELRDWENGKTSNPA